MGPVRMARSALLLLLCGLVLCWHANGQNDKFTYKFDLGGMVCTNLASGVICSNPPPYAMNTAGSSVSHRNIISFDTDGNYALGFEKATLGSWYLSIYKYNPSDQSSGASIWRAKTVDGVDVKANENSTLGFIESGNLELRNAQGSLVSPSYLSFARSFKGKFWIRSTIFFDYLLYLQWRLQGIGPELTFYISLSAWKVSFHA